MYAVINSGGKQYRLSEGDVVKVEYLEGEVGEQVEFDDVLFVGGGSDAVVGTPSIAGGSVIGKIVEQGKGDKVVVFKFKKRKMFRKRTGHRQLYTAVRVETIETGKSAAKKSGKAAAKPKAGEAASDAAEA